MCYIQSTQKYKPKNTESKTYQTQSKFDLHLKSGQRLSSSSLLASPATPHSITESVDFVLTNPLVWWDGPLLSSTGTVHVLYNISTYCYVGHRCWHPGLHPIQSDRSFEASSQNPFTFANNYDHWKPRQFFKGGYIARFLLLFLFLQIK